MSVSVAALVDEGLGNSAYLVDLGDGRGLAVDVSVDLRALRQEARRRQLRIAFTADTHLHADFLSGSRQLSVDDGAVVLASRAGGREFAHRPLDDGDEVDLGGLRLRIVATPGHTHEHIAYELLDGDRVVGVFSGGSLIVGAAARTDLVSAERTEELARAQFHSIRRLAQLPDEVLVWPTHGAGSFCSAPPGADRTSTIGNERATNAFLRSPDEDAFVVRLLASLGSYPPYFSRLPELNRRGPALTSGTALPTITAADLRSLLAVGQSRDVEIVDVRPFAEFAAGHIQGALSNVLRPVFASWLGWLVPADKPIVIVRNPDQDPEEVRWQALKIGYDRVVGDLIAVPADWAAAGLPTATIALRDPSQLDGTEVLDIRQDGEFAAGHLPGVRHVELGALGAGTTWPQGPTTLMCGHGERAMSAASLMARAGHRNLSVLTGGPEDWSDATGRRLEVSR